MEKMSHIPEKGTKKRVVIVGGGFGGLKLARELDDEKFQIILIDQNNYHLFQPLLYQVATSAIEPSEISFPFRRIFKRRKNFHIRVCRAEEVLPDENRLLTSIGFIDYDYLVIATGSRTNFFGNQELGDLTMQLKNTSEALFDRNKIIESFERALNSEDEGEQGRLLTFVIVGGGATGVELAGALAEMKRFVFPSDYPDLDVNRMRIILVDGADRLLGAFTPGSSDYAERYLKDKGVEIRLNALVKEYDGKALTFVNGEAIETCNVFWVAGVKANGLKGFSPDTYGKGYRLIVDEFSRVKGMGDIFAIGDTAIMITSGNPHGHPQVVQPAIQQARLLAKNLYRILAGRPLQEFKYRNKGAMATIGRNSAVVELNKIRFSGAMAWMLWLFVHLMSIVGVKNRLFIFINWMWSYVTYDQALRLWIRPEEKQKKVS